MSDGIKPGTSIGPYTFDEALADGAYALVWRGHHDERPDIPIAIKVIRNADTSTPQAKAWINQEIAILRKIHHPLIPELFDVLDDSANTYMIMEFVRQYSLHNSITAYGRLTEVQARRYFMQLISVLDYLHHEQSIAHLDVKCENILIDANDNIRLTSFGFSRQFSVNHPDFHATCGSPAYTAPEMLAGHLCTRIADVWSSGVLLYAMVTGQLPFDDTEIQRLFQKIMYTQPFFPTFLPIPLIDLLGKMLCKDTERRIDLELIKVHPWFPQSEYSAMVEMINGAIGASTSEFVVERIIARAKVTERMKGLVTRVAHYSPKPIWMARIGKPRTSPLLRGSSSLLPPTIAVIPEPKADIPRQQTSVHTARGHLMKMMTLRSREVRMLDQ
jgi:serine/threonine protein kinase